MNTAISRLAGCVAVTSILGLGAAGPATAQSRVSETVHNLSSSGPGTVRAVSEEQVCIFCHAPHNTGGVQPLWNRELPASSYRIYQSTTLDANPGQPTGASKLCLSCHDGTIALGSVLSRADRVRMAGEEFMPAGLANLGTDLSDDHPISFRYTSGLAASDAQLADPQTLPMEIRLDATSQLQCTACHEPHNNQHGNFLVLTDRYGALCIACHKMSGWDGSSHHSSPASTTGAETALWPYSSVAENSCRSCHRSHTAEGRERLLIFEEEENCLSCHQGLVAATNILAEIDKPERHDPRRYLGDHDPTETYAGTRDHVECSDCHNPHAVSPPSPSPTYVEIGATLVGRPRCDSGRVHIDHVSYEYEVCFRCHGDSAVQSPRSIGRQSQTSNLRLRFASGNPSFHPIVSSSPSTDTVSLRPGLASGSMIRCTDCHNNNQGQANGGSGPDGPHGSIYDYLLEKNYTVIDDTNESAFDYALCYKCHERSSILSDDSFPEHRRHIEEERTPCSACHDPHGVSSAIATTSDHTHLINFDTTIVRPETTTRRLEFRDDGRFAGSCTLTCHGENHRDETYRK